MTITVETIQDSELYPVSTVSRLLKRTPQTVNGWARSGRIRSVQYWPGSPRLIPGSEVRRLCGRSPAPNRKKKPAVDPFKILDQLEQAAK